MTEFGAPNPEPQPAAPPPQGSKAALKLFIQRWVITMLGVLVAANVLQGIRYDSIEGLFVASLLLGVFNAIFGRIKLVLGCLTLGVFALIMNALLLMFVAAVVDPFHVDDFWTAFWGGLVISLVAVVVASLTGAQVSPIRGSFRVRAERVSGRSPRDRDDDDGPPIIDV